MYSTHLSIMPTYGGTQVFVRDGQGNFVHHKFYDDIDVLAKDVAKWLKATHKDAERG